MGSWLQEAPPFPTAELGGELCSPDRLVGSGSDGVSKQLFDNTLQL